MSENVSALFEPFQLKKLRLNNRFVLAPMSLYNNPKGIPTAEFAEYHRQRAVGAGLSISGATGIDRPASNNHPQLANINEASLNAWKHVVERVHTTGNSIALQLWHAGALFNVEPKWQPAPLESPSGLVEANEKVGEPMTDEQVADCIAEFGQAAKRAREVGFDAVEIHGAHGFLIDQFFWQDTNLRQDRWGGKTLAERNAFALEVIKAVRAAIDDDMVLSMRVSQFKEQDYDFKLAKTPRELEAWLLPLAEAGVDLFHCSQRRYWEPEFAGSDLNFAGWVKKVTELPTITVGSVGLSNDISSFFNGEQAQRQPLDELIRRLDRGDFDLVAVGRALLVDPNWAEDVREGKIQENTTIDMGKVAEIIS